MIYKHTVIEVHDQVPSTLAQIDELIPKVNESFRYCVLKEVWYIVSKEEVDISVPGTADILSPVRNEMSDFTAA